MLSKNLFHKICFAQRRFVADTKGAVAIYVTIMLPVLIGVGVLAVDASRLYNLQSLLQKGADSLALAGAAELDRELTAIARSNNAINNLVQNQHKFSVGGLSNIAVSQVRFLSGLPANDSDAIDASFVTADPTLARFVEVTVTPAALNTILPASFIGGANAATARASAVAGFDSAVCNFTPIFICNPFENSGMTIREAAADPAVRRRQIELRQQGGNESQYFPGIYGFLDPDYGNTGANTLRDMIASSNPPACFIKNGVNLRPGFISTARDAFNVRFDMYEGPMGGKKNDDTGRYRPAQNVRKGYSVNSCSQSQGSLPDYQGLPRDDCFASGSCTHMGGRMGNGNWDFQSYWETNFGGGPPAGFSFDDPPSRYEIYRHEIDNNLMSSASPGGETGDPQCYGDTSTLSDKPDRRILYGALLNCLQLEAEYGISGGSGGPYPVEEWVEFFITEPVETGQDQNIHVELVDIVNPGEADSVAKDIVQLYR